jgi:hypothetical protein
MMPGLSKENHVKIDGACHCGHITYEAEIDPANVLICHCTDCQTLSGSAFRTVVFTEKGTFRLLSGAPKTYFKIGESGARRAQCFCPECGTPIYATADEENPQVHGLRVGTIRQRAELDPRRQVYARSCQPWVADLAPIPANQWSL